MSRVVTAMSEQLKAFPATFSLGAVRREPDCSGHVRAVDLGAGAYLRDWFAVSDALGNVEPLGPLVGIGDAVYAGGTDTAHAHALGGGVRGREGFSGDFKGAVMVGRRDGMVVRDSAFY